MDQNEVCLRSRLTVKQRAHNLAFLLINAHSFQVRAAGGFLTKAFALFLVNCVSKEGGSKQNGCEGRH